LTPASGRGQTLYYQSQEVPTSRARQTRLRRKSTESMLKTLTYGNDNQNNMYANKKKIKIKIKR
jgi:hypothetical protein